MLYKIMTKIDNNIAIGILNGGKSSRMGSPKSLIKYKNMPLAEIIYKEAIQITNEVYFLGNSPIPSSIKNPVILNDLSGKGPLGGLSAIAEASKKGCFIWAIDMPLPDKSDILELLSLSENYTKPVIPYNNESAIFESCFAFYTFQLLNEIKRLTKSEHFISIQFILKHLNIEGNSQIFKKLQNKLKSWNYPIDIIQ